jgi:murein DD-endopeptidase MepM/ murein hydrolase activator NlpD
MTSRPEDKKGYVDRNMLTPTRANYGKGYLPGVGQQGGGDTLGSFMAGLRAIVGGNYNYEGQRENGVTPFGAYGMLKENWNEWANAAGYRGAAQWDADAQDAVAGFWAQQFHERYGSWGMVANAWFGGQQQADQLMREGRDEFRSERMKAWKKAVMGAQKEFVGASAPVSARKWVTTNDGYWMNPIAGESEYSGGSWMPNTLTHRGRTHAAIDVYAKKGTPIVAPVSGTVKRVKTGNIGGNTVTLLGDDGITYYFAHMEYQSELTQGTQIGAGQHIGYVGNTGSASNTSPHLHMSMKQGGKSINPKSFLDGSTNASGFFKARGAAIEMGSDPDRQMEGMMNGMLERVSTGIVPTGKTRLDPRTIGVNAAGEKPVAPLPDDHEYGRPQGQTLPPVQGPPDEPRDIVSSDRGPY